MSISLVSSPIDYSPANNPIVFEFSSTNYLQCDFNYVLDVYVNGTYVIRLKSFPNSSGNGVFDISKVLQQYLTFDFNPNVATFTKCPNSIIHYYVEARERYDTSSDCLTGVTLQAVDYTSSPAHAWNGALQYKKFTEYNLIDYSLTDDTSSPLTTLPDNYKLTLNDNFTLSILQQYTVLFLKLVTYDYSDSVIDTYYLTNPYDTAPSPDSADNNFLIVPAGPRNLNIVTFDGSPIPSQPVIDSTVKYYEITFLSNDSPEAPVSITKTFTIDTRCYDFTTYRIWWLNRLGGFDSTNFNMKSKKIMSITRQSHTKLLSNDYAVGDRGKSITTVQADNTFTLNSDFMSEEESIWIQDLFSSPEVILYTQRVQEVDLVVEGLQYNSGYLNIQVQGTLSVGATFTGNPAHLAAFGITGPITGVILEDIGSGIYKTDVIAPIDPGMSIISSGTITANTYTIEHIPVILLESQAEEKVKKNVKNISYSITVTPSYSLNTQSL